MSKKLSPVNIGKRGGGSLVNLLALAILLVVLSSRAIAQMVVEPGIYTNNASIDTVIVNGILFNVGNAHVESATVNDLGWIDNSGKAVIESAVFNGSGESWNYNDARIGLATINDQVLLRNSGNARIDETIINGGSLVNDKNATLGSAVVTGGALQNFDRAAIGNVVVDGGKVTNYGDDSVFTGGGEYDMVWFNPPQKTAVLESVQLFNGIVENTSRIENLYYAGGTYYGNKAQIGPTMTSSGLGIVGTLTLAGNAADNTGNWGIVENLAFASDGSGFMTVTAFADDTGFGFTPDIQARNFIIIDSGERNVFNQTIWNVDYMPGTVDLTYGNIRLDFGNYERDLFDTLFADNLIDLSALFGADVIIGEFGISSFEISWDTGSPFLVYGNGAFAEGWGFTGYNNATVPEPATLAIIGLGLAGLGLARRRRKP